jgi:hypothetical protein
VVGGMPEHEAYMGEEGSLYVGYRS